MDFHPQDVHNSQLWQISLLQRFFRYHVCRRTDTHVRFGWNKSDCEVLIRSDPVLSHHQKQAVSTFCITLYMPSAHFPFCWIPTISDAGIKWICSGISHKNLSQPDPMPVSKFWPYKYNKLILDFQYLYSHICIHISQPAAVQSQIVLHIKCNRCLWR